MGTPAIIIVNDCGIYKTCRCSSDGYLEHTGSALQDHYYNRDLALSLVEGGDFKGLYKDITRFRGLHSGIRQYSTLDAIIASSEYCDFIYLFEDDVWSLVDKSSKKRLYWYHMEIDHRVDLECAICEFKEKVMPDSDFGDWALKVFLGKKDLGPVCPRCRERFTRINKYDEYAVVIENIVFDEAPGLLNIFLGLTE